MDEQADNPFEPSGQFPQQARIQPQPKDVLRRRPASIQRNDPYVIADVLILHSS
jgi:hypothetical protein